MRQAAHSQRFVLSAVLAALCGMAAAAHGHDFSIVEAQLQLETEEDGSPAFSAELIVDLDALLLGVGAGHDPQLLLQAIDGLPADERIRREEKLRQLFQRRARVFADGEAVEFTVEFPGAESSPWARGFTTKAETRLGVVARLHGRLPATSEAVSLRLSRAFGTARFQVARGSVASPIQLVPPGAESEPVFLADLARPASALQTVGRYARLGFLHILPRGLDHVLFLVGLCLLPSTGVHSRGGETSEWSRSDWARALRALLVLVTMFTLAHAVTLGLSIYGVVNLPGALVEPLIAASIFVVAVETLAPRQPSPWLRRGVVFGFGLLHGLGFASVLAELGLGEGNRLLALLGFHIGVEGGQLVVVAIAVGLLWPWATRRWYRPALASPIALAICGLALFWLGQRLLF